MADEQKPTREIARAKAFAARSKAFNAAKEAALAAYNQGSAFSSKVDADAQLAEAETRLQAYRDNLTAQIAALRKQLADARVLFNMDDLYARRRSCNEVYQAGLRAIETAVDAQFPDMARVHSVSDWEARIKMLDERMAAESAFDASRRWGPQVSLVDFCESRRTKPPTNYPSGGYASLYALPERRILNKKVAQTDLSSLSPGVYLIKERTSEDHELHKVFDGINWYFGAAGISGALQCAEFGIVSGEIDAKGPDRAPIRLEKLSPDEATWFKAIVNAANTLEKNKNDVATN